MKRILLKFVILFAFVGAVTIFSCDTYIEPPIPECQEYQTGDIKVVNKTGFATRFDIYSDDSSVGKSISNGGSYTWLDVDAGYYTMWIWFPQSLFPDSPGWHYWKQDQRLVACEILTFTWILDTKKSSKPKMYLEISRDGEIIQTVMDFKRGDRK